MRRDRENQKKTEGYQAWGPNMDLIRVPPYGPAAHDMPHQQAE